MSNTKKTVTCFLLLFFLLQAVESVKAFNLRKINNAENLSSSNVHSLYQDKKGVIWIGTARGIDRYDGKHVTKYSPKQNENFFTGSRIDRIKQVGDHLIGIQTYHGLHVIDTRTSAIRSFDMFNRVVALDKDRQGSIFLVQGNNSVYYKSTAQEQFDQLLVPGLRANDILDLAIDKEDKLWIFSKEGVSFCFSIRTNKQGRIDLTPSAGYRHPAGILYCTHEDNRNFSFIDDTYALYEFNTSTQTAIFVCDLKPYITGKASVTSLLKFHDDYFIGFKNGGASLLRKTTSGHGWENLAIPGEINCLYKDKYQDIVWIGTSGQGVYTYSVEVYSFKSFLLSDFTLKRRQPVTAIWVDSENTLWLGSRGDGILRIFNFEADKNIEECRTESITAFNTRLPDNTILCLAESRRGDMWIGSERGLSYFKRKEKTVVPVPLSYGDRTIESISSVYEQDSVLWISTNGNGIIKATLAWRNTEPVVTCVKQFWVKEDDELTNYFLSIYPENDSILWCTNKGEGVFRLNTVTSEMKNLRFEGSTINETNVIRKDYLGNYLIGTNFGMIKYNAGDYKVLNDRNAFLNHSVYSMLSYSPYSYWLSTNRGLILYYPDTEEFRTYDHQDGLSVLEFCEGASFHQENTHTLFFGGTNGFVAIQREYVDESRHYMPPIYFKTITIRDRQYPIEEFLSRKKKDTFLKLSHEQNFFTLSFAAIDHLNGNSYSYYYKLDGEGKAWTYNGNSDVISFADLHPGSYRLYVKYFNRALGKESYLYKMDIEVFPPWYATAWAYGGYSVCTLVVLGIFVRMRYKADQKKRAEQRRKLAQKHKEEIYESKLQFFTNISHEFCTPLTLIYGPCNRLMQQKSLPAPARKYTSIIKQNAERLNSLIQDLIEFNRIESGYKQPVIVPLDLAPVAGKLVESFVEVAESRSIAFEKAISPFLTWNSDKNFLLTILSNLLSNAFKYAENEKKVRIEMGICEDHLCITVSNTGKGIAEKDIPTLFDRYRILQNFEQSDPYWSRHGLGLAISYTMIRLLKGTIEVESIPDEWTHFKVKLPYLTPSETESTSDKEETASLPAYRFEQQPAWQIPKNIPDESKPTLLIVDDEIEIQWLIFDIFKDEYNLLAAVNPVEAFEILKDIHPDLIISDLIMQGMDGLSFSRQLKADETTVHIPFILLSAKRDMEIQTEGLNAGADIYITKPFHVDYLKSSVRRLLERKENLKEYFSSPLSSYTLEKGKFSHKEDRKFINEILKIINKNIRDKELSAPLIAGKMNIGLRTFYRRLEEIEGTSLTDLINTCRLIKAADLLVKTRLTIDEIVFQSGFTNRSTFYRSFSKKYNCTPTAYRKQHTLEGAR